MVQVRDLRIHFKSKNRVVRAVDGVSFDLNENEILGIVGETGSGKSITARSLMGLLPMPPAVIAGGSVTFRPGGRVPVLPGARLQDLPVQRQRGVPRLRRRGMPGVRGHRPADDRPPAPAAVEDASAPRPADRDDLPGPVQVPEPGTQRPRPGGRGLLPAPHHRPAGRRGWRPGISAGAPGRAPGCPRPGAAAAEGAAVPVPGAEGAQERGRPGGAGVGRRTDREPAEGDGELSRTSCRAA